MKSALVAACLLFSLLLTGCTDKSSPEQAIRSRIEVMETALADRSTSDFLDVLSESFVGGGYGHMDIDREGARKMLAIYFLRYHRIQIAVSQVEIIINEYQPSMASASARIALAGGENLLPKSGGLYEVRSDWHELDGDWQITRLEWR